jgi:hypothetical protein
MVDLAGLPAAEKVAAGIRDLNDGILSIEALLVSAAIGRLRSLGLTIRDDAPIPAEPELAFYRALGREHQDPYPRYNSLRQELDSFLAALEARLARARRVA